MTPEATTKQIAALKELAGAIEVGESWHGYAFDRTFPTTCADGIDISLGSIDAAKILHEAITPNWGWRVQDMGTLDPAAVLALRDEVITVRHKEPSVAFLLAIISAKVSELENGVGE